MNTKFEVIILTESYLGLENGDVNNFSITQCMRLYNTVVYLKDTLTVFSITEFNKFALTLEITFKLSKMTFVLVLI